MELLKGLRNEDYDPLFSCVFFLFLSFLVFNTLNIVNKGKWQVGEQKVRGRFGLAFCWPYFLVMNFTVFQHLFTLLC